MTTDSVIAVLTLFLTVVVLIGRAAFASARRRTPKLQLSRPQIRRFRKVAGALGLHTTIDTDPPRLRLTDPGSEVEITVETADLLEGCLGLDFRTTLAGELPPRIGTGARWRRVPESQVPRLYADAWTRCWATDRAWSYGLRALQLQHDGVPETPSDLRTLLEPLVQAARTHTFPEDGALDWLLALRADESLPRPFRDDVTGVCLQGYLDDPRVAALGQAAAADGRGPLRLFAAQATADIDALAALATDPEETAALRKRAYAALERDGHDTRPVMRTWLDDADPSLRQLARRRLIPDRDPAALRHLKQGMFTGDRARVLRTIDRLRQFGGQEVIPPLADGLRRFPDREVLAAAVAAAEQCGAEDMTPLERSLVVCLEHEQPRTEAIEALGRLGSLAAIAPLEALRERLGLVLTGDKGDAEDAIAAIRARCSADDPTGGLTILDESGDGALALTEDGDGELAILTEEA